MTGKWETLNMFDVDDAAPTGIKGKGSKLRKRVEKLNAARPTFDADKASFQGQSDDEALAAEGIAKSQALKSRQIELLTTEVALRKELASLRTEYQASLAGPFDEAIQNEQTTRDEVLSGLVALGFNCSAGADQNEVRRHKAFCNGNLRVRQAVGRKDEIAAWMRDREFSRANDAAIKAVTDELARIRKQLTTI